VEVDADVSVTIWQAEGVLMEVLTVDAAGALLWLMRTAAQRRQPLEAVAAEVVERRSV
jgi:AmiR/NasT family two-component response regulator